MKEVIMEYAGSVIALLGTISFFSILGRFFLGKESMIAILIVTVLEGV